MPQFDARQRAVRMHLVGHECEVADIAIVPVRGERVRMVV